MNTKALTKPKLTENAETVLKKRYFIKDEKGEPIETAEGLFARVAEAVNPPLPAPITTAS